VLLLDGLRRGIKGGPYQRNTLCYKDSLYDIVRAAVVRYTAGYLAVSCYSRIFTTLFSEEAELLIATRSENEPSCDAMIQSIILVDP
jgi:hypothetical protein